MLAKYDTSFFFYQEPKRAQCTFIFRSFTLRELKIISLGKRLVISQCLTVSRCKRIVELAAKCLI